MGTRACQEAFVIVIILLGFCDAVNRRRAYDAQPEGAPMGWLDDLDRWRRESRPGRFWRRVTAGLTLAQLWLQFRKETTASYRVYSKAAAPPGGESSRGSWPRTARTLFWAMLSKLSPARRVFLLLTLVVLLWGLGTQLAGRMLLGALMLLVLLALELADRVAMKRDLEIAREIQGWLLPKQPPEIAGVDIAFTTRPANTVAGDFYDAFLRHPEAAAEEPSPLLLVVADVAGKSMPAALLMATFQASLRTVAHESTTLPELVGRVNRYACEHSLEGRRFTTAFFAELDPVVGTLRYVNAGHNPPLLRRVGGELVRLEAGGLPLGIREAPAYESQALTLGRGDLLVIYTDGIVEAENERHEEYGEARLAELVRALPAVSSAEGLAQILASVTAFTGAAPQLDDTTCMVVRYPAG
jgi:serine phosphatase RsbU (regulator of sigma subunit)